MKTDNDEQQEQQTANDIRCTTDDRQRTTVTIARNKDIHKIYIYQKMCDTKRSIP